jgi:hypothetical protein
MKENNFKGNATNVIISAAYFTAALYVCFKGDNPFIWNVAQAYLVFSAIVQALYSLGAFVCVFAYSDEPEKMKDLLSTNKPFLVQWFSRILGYSTIVVFFGTGHFVFGGIAAFALCVVALIKHFSGD